MTGVFKVRNAFNLNMNTTEKITFIATLPVESRYDLLEMPFNETSLTLLLQEFFKSDVEFSEFNDDFSQDGSPFLNPLIR